MCSEPIAICTALIGSRTKASNTGGLIAILRPTYKHIMMRATAIP